MNNQIKIYRKHDCKIVETTGWTLHLLKNGNFRLLPPIKWLLELVDLIENKTINHNSAKIVIEAWRSETLERINKGINELQALFYS